MQCNSSVEYVSSKQLLKSTINAAVLALRNPDIGRQIRLEITQFRLVAWNPIAEATPLGKRGLAIPRKPLANPPNQPSPYHSFAFRIREPTHRKWKIAAERKINVCRCPTSGSESHSIRQYVIRYLASSNSDHHRLSWKRRDTAASSRQNALAAQLVYAARSGRYRRWAACCSNDHVPAVRYTRHASMYGRVLNMRDSLLVCVRIALIHCLFLLPGRIRGLPQGWWFYMSRVWTRPIPPWF